MSEVVERWLLVGVVVESENIVRFGRGGWCMMIMRKGGGSAENGTEDR